MLVPSPEAGVAARDEVGLARPCGETAEGPGLGRVFLYQSQFRPPERVPSSLRIGAPQVPGDASGPGGRDGAAQEREVLRHRLVPPALRRQRLGQPEARDAPPWFEVQHFPELPHRFVQEAQIEQGEAQAGIVIQLEWIDGCRMAEHRQSFVAAAAEVEELRVKGQRVNLVRVQIHCPPEALLGPRPVVLEAMLKEAERHVCPREALVEGKRRWASACPSAAPSSALNVSAR